MKYMYVANLQTDSRESCLREGKEVLAWRARKEDPLAGDPAALAVHRCDGYSQSVEV